MNAFLVAVILLVTTTGFICIILDKKHSNYRSCRIQVEPSEYALSASQESSLPTQERTLYFGPNFIRRRLSFSAWQNKIIFIFFYIYSVH